MYTIGANSIGLLIHAHEDAKIYSDAKHPTLAERTDRDHFPRQSQNLRAPHPRHDVSE